MLGKEWSLLRVEKPSLHHGLTTFFNFIKMPRRVRKSIGRRHKKHSLTKTVEGKSGDVTQDVPIIVNRESDERNEEEWIKAWNNFYIGDNSSSPSFKTSSIVTDSDGFSADQYVVVLHKTFLYSPDDDLDNLVLRLKTDRRCELYMTLSKDIQCSGKIHGLQYVATDKHGIRLWQPYLHTGLMSMKLQFTITPMLKPTLHVHGNLINSSHDFWTGLPKVVTSFKDLKRITSKLASWDVCIGNHDDCYVTMIPPGRTIDHATKPCTAYREDICAERGDTSYESTIRSAKCSFLVRDHLRCAPCKLYRHTLRSKASRERRSNSKENSPLQKSTSHKNMKKETLIQKIDAIRSEKKDIQSELEKLRKKVRNIITTKGHELSHAENKDLLDLVEEYKEEVEKSFPDEISTQRLFWDQQIKFASLKNKTVMRWHPMIIKWCLYLKSKSKKAYDAARGSGFISLPSSRTLFDYSHALPSKCGFHTKYIQHLKEEAEKLGMFQEEYKSYVGILQDEIKVSEGLVYDKNSGELVGYVDLDQTGNDINNLEQSLTDTKPKLASSILVVMIRGITTSLKYPLFCLATGGITAGTLYSPIWETVRVLENDCGLKPLFITCDGATPNRKFFKLQAIDNNEHSFWTWNMYSYPPRKLYFVSDVPHLLKTARNCFSSSGANTMSRHLWKDGKSILWTHVLKLYEDHVEGALFTHCPKLTRHHIHLTSFAKMKVNLAAQVLSSTVADALEGLYGDHVSETVQFMRHMNRFFDCLNTRNLSEARQKRNPNLAEYRSPDDPRLTFLTQEFMKYFEDWEQSVMQRPGDYTRGDRRRMLLSQQTLNGLRISVNSIVECVKFLLGQGAEFILTHRFNQDPLEEHFSHYRQKGGSNDNPTVYDVKNTLCQMRVIGSTALAPIRGNISKRRKEPMQVDNSPLAKRKR